MPEPPPTTPAGNLAALLRRLVHLVVTQSLVGRLPMSLNGLIIDRIRGINQLFARIAAGRFFPRRRPTAPRQAGPAAKPANRLPRKFGWLRFLVPEAVQSAGQLDNLLRDPQMVALMQAAPGPAGRALRPLCRMLGLRPPEILALPAKPRKPREKQPRAKRDPPPPHHPPTPPDAPAWMHGMPHSIRVPLLRNRTRSPPRTA